MTYIPTGRLWKDLEAEGIKRCCVYLTSRSTGKTRRCARRAVEDSSWCDKHKPVMDSVTDWNNYLITKEAGR